MNITFISPIAWDNSGGAHRPVQFAQELARRGHAVTYVEIEKSRAPLPDTNPRVLNFQTLGWDDVNFLRAWYGLEYASPADAATRLVAQLPSASAQNIVVCLAPFRPALELLPALTARGYALVYDVLDDISEMRALGAYCYDDLAEQYLARHADLIVTLSPRLTEKFRAQKNVQMMRDGVDLTPFQNPAPLQHTPITRGELTIGFWGTMWEYNLDLALVQNITRARPDWQWHFIGAYDLDPARPSLAAQLNAPNVHFHPSVARSVLAQYAQNFDVCILPTPVTPFNLARDPLKVYEYLACDKPVVATNLEQLAGMPYVSLARDADEFLQYIERAARVSIERAARVSIDRAELDAYLREQTWAKRTDALERAFETVSAHAREIPSPPRGAMPHAQNELDRAQAYAQHLERLVRDRDTHIRALQNALAQSGIASKIKRALRP